MPRPPVSLAIGPSEISDAVKCDLADIAARGLLSESHRGPVVKAAFKQAVCNLRDALRLPEAYGICFQPSATAAMELVLRNLVAERSFHFVQGAFAGRFAATADQIGLAPECYERAWDASPAPGEAEVPAGTELIAITPNETSTGRRWPWEAVRAVRARHPEPLLALDVTSLMGAVLVDWHLADVWFCSVQKCLGLPAGLGIVVAGPRTLEKARRLGGARRVAGWQDLPGLVEQLTSGQTPETPNVLAVALLGRQMARWDLNAIDASTRRKARIVAEAIGDEAFFVRDPAWRSLTTHAIQVGDAAAWMARAAAAGYAISPGYGPLKGKGVRIATFPSVTEAQIAEAMSVLSTRG